MVKKIKYIDYVTSFHLTNGKIYEGVEDGHDINTAATHAVNATDILLIQLNKEK